MLAVALCHVLCFINIGISKNGAISVKFRVDSCFFSSLLAIKEIYGGEMAFSAQIFFGGPIHIIKSIFCTKVTSPTYVCNKQALQNLLLSLGHFHCR